MMKTRTSHLQWRWFTAVLCCFCLSVASSFSPASAKHHKQSSDPQSQSEPSPSGQQSPDGSAPLQGGTDSTTLQGGTKSTLLQTSTQSTTIHGGTSGALIQGGVEDQTGPVNILFLLDASFSMREKITGVPKMECAKQVLQDAMRRIPPDVNVGLRVFGQRFMGFVEADCRATALLVPLGTGNRGSVIKEVRQIEPYGMTPLAFALLNAAEDDFRGVVGRKVIILITDGMDTCGGNPCQVIEQLPRYGINIKVDVVGVDLKHDQHAKDQLKCIADTSKGKYYDANTAADLIDSISNSVDKAISGRVIIHNTPAKNTETPPELVPQHATPDSPLDAK